MKPYLFLHIPRTGGTSIRSILPHGYTNVSEINNLLKNQTPSESSISIQHRTMDEFAKFKTEFFTFTFVRNPWDRFVSVFEHQINNCDLKLGFLDVVSNKPVIHDDKTLQFFEFVTFVKDRWKNGLLNLQFDGHLRRQIDFTHTKERKKILDYIGRYETMQEDLKNLNDICGWNNECIEIPMINQSKNRPHSYRNYYQTGNGIAKEFVYQLYRDEIELFGYKF
jgi:chondroitin 4-sulfotransferase 11